MKNESIFYKPTLLLIDLLTHSLIVFLSHMTDSNRRPTHYECVALPTELKWLFEL